MQLEDVKFVPRFQIVEITDAMLEEMNLTQTDRKLIDRTCNDIERQLYEQIVWATNQLCKAQRDEVYGDEQAWHGYIQALRWVQKVLFAPKSCPAPIPT
jgi:hypothetical protein